MLWEGFPREEATWEIEGNITAAALRYLFNTTAVTLLINCSTFLNPDPPQRIVLDAVANLKTSICTSLRAGTIRNCTFTCNFRRDVFNCLFTDKGSVCSRRRGKLYNECDFNVSFFSSLDFVVYNKFGEGFCVDFPVYMYSYIKFSPVCYSVCGAPLNRDFTECLSVNLCKKCC